MDPGAASSPPCQKYRMPPHKLATGPRPRCKYSRLRARSHPLREIAEALSKSPGTVQNTQWRAIRRLRKMAKERDSVPGSHFARDDPAVGDPDGGSKRLKIAELAEPPRVQQCSAKRRVITGRIHCDDDGNRPGAATGLASGKLIQHDVAHSAVPDGLRIGEEPRVRCGCVNDDAVGWSTQDHSASSRVTMWYTMGPASGEPERAADVASHPRHRAERRQDHSANFFGPRRFRSATRPFETNTSGVVTSTEFTDSTTAFVGAEYFNAPALVAVGNQLRLAGAATSGIAVVQLDQHNHLRVAPLLRHASAR